MALTFKIHLRPNASSDRREPKRQNVELFKGYRLV